MRNASWYLEHIPNSEHDAIHYTGRKPAEAGLCPAPKDHADSPGPANHIRRDYSALPTVQTEGKSEDVRCHGISRLVWHKRN